MCASKRRKPQAADATGSFRTDQVRPQIRQDNTRRETRSAMSAAQALLAALALAAEGLPCFPCAPNKQPACPRGFKAAVTDPASVEKLFRQHPGPLVGIPTGETSGLDVLDIDPRHG